MKYLVPAIVVLILVVGALIAYSMHNRSVTRKSELRELRERVHKAENTVLEIEHEVDIQLTGNYPDAMAIRRIINTHFTPDERNALK